MLLALVLENEIESKNLLLGYLAEYCPQIKVIAAVDNIQAAYKSINEFNPDIAFLDIELGGETSFDLLDKFSPIPFDIIFTTAHENYMLKAIKLSAVDYLLKPIHPEELQIAVNKVSERKDQKIINKNLKILMHNFKGLQPDYMIAVSTFEGFVFIKVSNILYLQSDGSYTEFFIKDGNTILTSKNIKEYENLLSDHGFFRIHKQYIVNLREVTRYIRGEGGNVILSNGKSLDVSRRRKEEFINLLNKM